MFYHHPGFNPHVHFAGALSRATGRASVGKDRWPTFAGLELASHASHHGCARAWECLTRRGALALLASGKQLAQTFHDAELLQDVRVFTHQYNEMNGTAKTSACTRSTERIRLLIDSARALKSTWGIASPGTEPLTLRSGVSIPLERKMVSLR